MVPVPTADSSGGPQTFSRACRLLTAADFDGVFKQGQRSADKYFTVLFRCGSGSNSRLGFAISRQRIRLAVDRNRLRRLVRESFRRHRASLPPVDLVIMARETAAHAASGELRASIEKHWANIRKARTAPPGPTPRNPQT